MSASTKVTININNKTHKVQPRQGYADVVGVSCPHCDSSDLRVVGSNKAIGSDDRSYEADGFCVACNNPVGRIIAKVSTLFGLTEDEAVLKHGRARIY